MRIEDIIRESGNNLDGDGYIKVGKKYINYVIVRGKPRIYKCSAELAQEVSAIQTNFKFRY